jgi:magnesium chelatase subunit I
LDILFVFTANPEDYTNRGSIVTPLKDRIESQIITHYPKSVELSKAITEQESRLLDEQLMRVEIPDLCKLLVEQIAMEARKSEYVDQKSGVSARLTITAFENLVSTAERRALKEPTGKTIVRIADFTGVLPAITGKIELVYEGEQEGPTNVGYRLIGLAIRSLFTQYFPDPQTYKRSSKEAQSRKKTANPYQPVIDWFGKANDLILLQHEQDAVYGEKLYQVNGLHAAVKQFYPKADDTQAALLMEFLLHGLAEFSLINKKGIEAGYSFGDILGSMLNIDFGKGEEEDDEF